MKSNSIHMQDSPSPEEGEIRGLYSQLLECWNKRTADDYASLCIDA